MKLEVLNPDEVRDQVREHYAERIRSASSCCSPAPTSKASAASCCGPSCGPSAIDFEENSTWGVALYSNTELAEVPEDAAAVSYGCGNPTALAALKPGEVVLDLGSGGGIDCFLAARKVGDRGFVYGVDMTDEMLDLARRNAIKAKVTNVEFRKGNIEALPLPDETVDVIISNCVVNLSPDKGEVLKEAFRVLRPGGRVAISDVVIDGDLSDLPVDEATVREALSWAGCIAGALTIDQFKQYLAEAGFEAIEVVIKQHYTLEALGQDVAGATQLLARPLAEELASRFTSSMIHARKPAAVIVEAATATDLAAVEALLHTSNLPNAGLAEHFTNAVVARAGQHVVGSAALEQYGNAALLRSVAVYPSLQGEGLGQRLTEAALTAARQQGIQHVYLLTTTAGDFFPRFGFQPIERSAAPESVKQSVEFTSACPESALVMHLALK